MYSLDHINTEAENRGKLIVTAGSEEGRWKWIQERVKGIIEGKRYSGSRERCSIREKKMATTTLGFLLGYTLT